MASFAGDIGKLMVRLLGDLQTWGYTRKRNAVGLRAALAAAMLARRSPHLGDLTRETLARLHREAHAKITRRGLVLLSYALVRRGLIREPLGRDGQVERKNRIDHRVAAEGVPQEWRQWCERWFATSTLQPSTRVSTVYRLFQVGRWLARPPQGKPGAAHLAQRALGHWRRGIAAHFGIPVGP